MQILIYTLVGSLEENPLAVKLLENRLYMDGFRGFQIMVTVFGLLAASKTAPLKLHPKTVPLKNRTPNNAPKWACEHDLHPHLIASSVFTKYLFMS